MKKRSILAKAISGFVSLTVTAQPLLAGSKPAVVVENARSITVDQILADSSSGQLGISNARLITDNDEAFNAKLNIVNQAKNNLYLTYFIYSNDYSSSLFNAALIKKAQSGTKVKILVDLTTNYAKMDLFRALVAAGNGNIEVKFYNKPSPGIQKIALMTVVGCSAENSKKADKSACDNEKKQKVAQIEAGAAAGNPQALQAVGLSHVFLSAYYGKSKNAGLVSVVGGQGIDVDYAKNLMDQDKAHKVDIRNLVQSGNKYRIKGSISDGMAASNANKALGDLTGESINFLTGVLPMNEINADPQLKNDYDHWTDYTHQKLIAADTADGRFLFQTGGRNIEDSYHLKTDFLPNLKEKQKYLFRDTDFYGEVSSGGEKIAQAFMRNWNFDQIVGTPDQIDELAPYDVQLALQKCDSEKPDFKQCATDILTTAAMHPEVLKQAAVERVKAELANMQKNAATFMQNYVVPTQGLQSSKIGKSKLFSFRGMGQDDGISANDLKTATITFIENLNSPKDTPTPVRVYGTTSGNEARDGRYISDLWLKGMESACALNKSTQVILHSAYLMPPSNMIRVLGKMADGTWDCSKVQVKIITNSFETTDLNVINILAQSEMQAIMQRNAMSSSPRKAQFRYYEYTKPQGQSQSLHTKLSLLGDDMIVGSANADIRSYYMDANTGVYIHNAPELAADYAKYIYSLELDKTIVDKTATFGSVVNGKYQPANYAIAVKALTDDVVSYWVGRSTEAQKEGYEKANAKYAKDRVIAQKFTNDLSNEVYVASNTIMVPPKVDDVQAIDAKVKKCEKNTKNDANVMKQIKKQVQDSDDYTFQNERQLIQQVLEDSCEQAVKSEQLRSVDPNFNNKFEAF